MSIAETRANYKYIILKIYIDKNTRKVYNAKRTQSAYYRSEVKMSALEIHKLIMEAK